jgi:hypothetical protein
MYKKDPNFAVPRHIHDFITQLYADKLDKELREAFEENEKPKKDHVGFNNNNKFFSKGRK